ncbi:MAG: efflux RND transporter permease subunit [Pseudomonadales bacterium]|nr:efflux RND transporter permease subunit [Pseudomonadales bacterium]
MSEVEKSGLINWFVNNPVAANLLMAFILIVGLVTANALRQEGFPPLPPKYITVSVTFESGSAAQAEKGIAMKIEDALQGLIGVKQIISESTAQGSTVTIEKQGDYPLSALLTAVKNRVDAIATFPGRAEKPIISAAQWHEHALWIQLFGPADETTLATLAREIRQALLRQPAIQKVAVHGLRKPEIEVTVDEQQLQAFNLSLPDVAEAISANSVTEVAGEIRNPQSTVTLSANQQRQQELDFAHIPLLNTPDGGELVLGDVAHIRDSYTQRTRHWMRFSGQPSVGLQIIMDNRSDINAITEQAHQTIQTIRTSGRLPMDVQIESWYDQSKFIQSRLSLMIENGVTGMALVFLVLALFLNLRIAFWVAMGLPVCFAGTFILMNDTLLDLSLNELTSFGLIIALGLVVDDAVVVGESVHTHHQRYGAHRQSTIQGVKRVATPTLFGILTTVAAFWPLGLVAGEMGKIFAQFAVIVVVCLSFSLLESKLILPAHLAPAAHPEKSPGTVARQRNIWKTVQTGVSQGLEVFTRWLYLPALKQALRYRYITLLTFIVFWLGSIALLSSGTVRYVFFPDVPGDTISGYFMLEDGAGYGLAEQHTDHIEQAIVRVNQAIMEAYNLDQPVIVKRQAYLQNDLIGEVTVELSPRSERPISTEEITQRWRAAVGSLEATDILKFVSSWVGAEDLRIELLADSTETLRTAGEAIKNHLQTLPGVTDIQDNLKPGIPQIQLTLSPVGRTLGLTQADLAKQIQYAYHGIEVQQFQRGSHEVKVWVRYPERLRGDITTLSEMRIRLPDARFVPLSVVATISESYGNSYITRIDNQRANFIVANVDKQITSPSAIIKILEDHTFPALLAAHPGLHIQLAGEAKEDAEASASLIKIFGLSLLLIYILLAVPLKSYSQPLLIMAAIPFGIMGAIVGHWIQGLPVSLLSLFGILALSGIVVNDSLLLVVRYNESRAQHKPIISALLEAGHNRLRAILLTSLTTFVGLLPLLRETSEQAQFLIPTAVSLAYGILFATTITLILIPILLAIQEDFLPDRRGADSI